ncbi:hypothetical protein BN341_17860 [Helicobacter heilmannii ASB1.4]|nr:hypothetical protein BN341_17860 [Helicobacter heilmannii ASB1.4]
MCVKLAKPHETLCQKSLDFWGCYGCGFYHFFNFAPPQKARNLRVARHQLPPS